MEITESEMATLPPQKRTAKKELSPEVAGSRNADMCVSLAGLHEP